MKRLITAAAAVLMAAGSFGAAAAQPGYGHHDRYDRHDRYERHDRGNGWRSDWRPGRRLDRGYWSRAERVDWRRHHLRAPPRGYEWRYVDGRYVLAAVATGLIASIILGSR